MRTGLVALLFLGGWQAAVAAAGGKTSVPPPPVAGWGVDACLTTHVEAETREAYLERLQGAGLRWLRERQPEASMADLQRAGYRVVAFTHFAGLSPKDPANQLTEDLRLVFAAAKAAQHKAGQTINAWEMVGEPDIGFCTDLPDRVAAYQKALYLGLKAGAAEAKRKPETGRRLGADGEANLKPEVSKPDSSALSSPSGLKSQVSGLSSPLVLMGALGMPPGPWLERAAANDLLDYTDAYNFHFYGHAKDLTGVIAAHGAAIATLRAKGEELGAKSKGQGAAVAALSAKGIERSESGEVPVQGPLPLTSMPKAETKFPLWITEAGIEAVDKKDWLNAERRQLQADFTISTAKQALAAEDVAMFMPFILVHDKDPYAMTLSPGKTFPAWDEYAKFTRENPWPKRTLATPPVDPSPVVVQWLPDNRTTVPHKVSGTYRFKGDAPIRGEVRIYNFSENEVTGRMEAAQPKNAVAILGAKGEGQRADGGRQRSEVRIPAMGMVSVPLEFTATGEGYFRETWSAAFVEVGRVVPHAPKEAPEGGLGTSRLTFVSRVSFGLEAWAKLADFTEEPLPLRVLPGGVIRFPQIEPYAPGEQVGAWTTMNGLKGEDVTLGSIQVSGFRSQVSAARFWIEKENTDPLAPTMAVAAVDGLPASGFLRLQLDKPMTKERKVLVVLVDDRGQRYSIWENFGADYYGSRSDVWLNLEDFHADFWGRMSADYQFRPERIREIHLRLYLSGPHDPVRVGLTLLKAK